MKKKKKTQAKCPSKKMIDEPLKDASKICPECEYFKIYNAYQEDNSNKSLEDYCINEKEFDTTAITINGNMELAWLRYCCAYECRKNAGIFKADLIKQINDTNQQQMGKMPKGRTNTKERHIGESVRKKYVLRDEKGKRIYTMEKLAKDENVCVQTVSRLIKRDKIILDEYNAGTPLAKIAQKVGISKEEVLNIINNADKKT